MSIRSKRLRLLAFVGVICVATALAEEVGVQVSSLDIRAGKGSMYAIVATLKQGDKLQILEKEPNGWLHVKSGENDGYVKDTALVPPKGGGFGEAFKGMNTGRTEASDPSASMAARGIGPGTTVYANSKNYSTDGLEEMMAAKDGVSGLRFILFTGEGNVGPAKQ